MKNDPRSSTQDLRDDNDLLVPLPKEKGWSGSDHLYLYQGFWWGVMAAQHFQACETDFILASTPKSGTTWLKALMFSIASRGCYTLSQNPLLTSNPHDLVPFLEKPGLIPNDFQSPRLFSTHIPFHSLPESIKNCVTRCRVVYLCRNPFDTFISDWHFLTKANPNSLDTILK
ncbi:P-loop containing nucleoside triphosphate hydrolases superfamily protein [Actinidia rufa]|uniref:Sulfotransferase n=1 Tax=Actinidia rufa TaxID=165716 RepID=A0A7J0F4C6_9ERIC|nr:P-loop containing nucleoside triphosphate hydrolases superfamily protein [Actinidia rufa]